MFLLNKKRRKLIFFGGRKFSPGWRRLHHVCEISSIRVCDARCDDASHWCSSMLHKRKSDASSTTISRAVFGHLVLFQLREKVKVEACWNNFRIFEILRSIALQCLRLLCCFCWLSAPFSGQAVRKNLDLNQKLQLNNVSCCCRWIRGRLCRLFWRHHLTRTFLHSRWLNRRRNAFSIYYKICNFRPKCVQQMCLLSQPISLL